MVHSQLCPRNTYVAKARASQFTDGLPENNCRIQPKLTSKSLFVHAMESRYPFQVGHFTATGEWRNLLVCYLRFVVLEQGIERVRSTREEWVTRSKSLMHICAACRTELRLLIMQLFSVVFYVFLHSTLHHHLLTLPCHASSCRVSLTRVRQMWSGGSESNSLVTINQFTTQLIITLCTVSPCQLSSWLQLVVHVGVSGIAKDLTLEQQAHNDGYDKPDEAGRFPTSKCCIEGAEPCLVSDIDMMQVCAAVKMSDCGVNACVSTDPGR